MPVSEINFGPTKPTVSHKRSKSRACKPPPLAPRADIAPVALYRELRAVAPHAVLCTVLPKLDSEETDSCDEDEAMHDREAEEEEERVKQEPIFYVM